jgi:hypothetical protein
MRKFRPGDALPEHLFFGIEEGWIEGLAYCESCERGYRYKVIVKDNRITGEVELLAQG